CGQEIVDQADFWRRSLLDEVGGFRFDCLKAHGLPLLPGFAKLPGDSTQRSQELRREQPRLLAQQPACLLVRLGLQQKLDKLDRGRLLEERQDAVADLLEPGGTVKLA